MDKKYIKAKKKLEKYNQKQILNLTDRFNSEEKNNIFEQINNLNFKQVNKLYNELTKKEKVNTAGIEEIVAINKDKLNADELERYNVLGKEILQENKYALVTMSGGQGTRLGYDKPKGTFKIDINPEPKYLFEIIVDKLKEESKKYNNVIPWYIMTSNENDLQIKEFFKEHNYFDYPESDIKFFKQGNLPLITEDKKLLIGKDKLIKEAADGNGGIFYSMYKNAILKDMKKRNIKWIFISSIDNILLKIADITLIGLAEDKKVEIATKSILRNSAEEKVGAICKNERKNTRNRILRNV